MDLEAALRRSFSFLLEEGFRVGGSRSGPREASAWLERDDVRVRAQLERPGSPYVSVARTSDGAVVESYALSVIVREAAPGDEARLEQPSPEAALQAAAQLLRAHGMDLLRGDFSRRDRLKRVRAEILRRDRQARFGTATGESPRFERRPSLAALFADAIDEGIRDARCVQARYDYGYDAAEVARFLGETEAEVQARLDRWDGL